MNMNLRCSILHAFHSFVYVLGSFPNYIPTQCVWWEVGVGNGMVLGELGQVNIFILFPFYTLLHQFLLWGRPSQWKCNIFELWFVLSMPSHMMYPFHRKTHHKHYAYSWWHMSQNHCYCSLIISLVRIWKENINIAPYVRGSNGVAVCCIKNITLSPQVK